MRQKSRQAEIHVTFITDKATLTMNFRATGKWISWYYTPELDGLPSAWQRPDNQIDQTIKAFKASCNNEINYFVV